MAEHDSLSAKQESNDQHLARENQLQQIRERWKPHPIGVVLQVAFNGNPIPPVDLRL